MTLGDVEKVLANERNTKQPTTKNAKGMAEAVEHSTEVAMTISNMQDLGLDFNEARGESLLDRHDRLKLTGAGQKRKAADSVSDQDAAKNALRIVRRDWPRIQSAYEIWHDNMII